MKRTAFFGSFQFGFRKDKNTVSELLTLFDILLDAKQDKKEILLIMYDLSSAFDLADHKILVAKLKVYRFHANALKWIGERPLMTSLVFWLFLTYLPTYIPFRPIWKKVYLFNDVPFCLTFLPYDKKIVMYGKLLEI